jgi:hypothetical protein
MLERGLAQEFDPNVRNFIDNAIDSVEQLEILLQLYEIRPHSKTAREINDQLQSNLKSVETRLKGLCDQGLLKCDVDRYVYFDSSPEVTEVLSNLADLYKHRRIRVIELIFSKPARPRDKFRDFSEAFILRKDPDNG